MLSRFIWVLILSSFSAVSARAANGVLYDCTITQKKERLDWIADKIAVVVLPGDKVVVSDAVVLAFHGEPIPASRVVNKGTRLDVRWTIRNATDSDNKSVSYFDYQAIIRKDSGKISVYAKPDVYSNRCSGKGTCVEKTGK